MEQTTETQDQTFQLVFSLKDINFILGMMAKQKCGDVYHLVASIHSQVTSQLQQKDAKGDTQE